MGRDLITDPYGRFYYLPLELKKLGYDVNVVTFSYRSNENEAVYAHGINWLSASLFHNPVATYREVDKHIRQIRPDWIAGCSDTYYGVFAVALAARIGCRSVIDAYDNYCAYIPWAKPLHSLWNRAVAQCDLATAAGPSIAQLWEPLRAQKRIEIIPMAPDPNGFYLRDKFRCRAMLGLPRDTTLVGYSGSINAARGISTLFDAIDIARTRTKNVRLVVSGRLAPSVKLPVDTINLGFLPTQRIPTLLNAFDVFAVLNKDSVFGNYSYPIKLYEAMACQTPVVASKTQSTNWILREHPELLVEPDDPGALANALLDAANRNRVTYGNAITWEESAKSFHEALSN